MLNNNQIKIVNSEIEKNILLKYKNVSFNYEYNVFSKHLEVLKDRLPKEIIEKVYNKEHFICFDFCQEALFEFVDVIYDTLVIGCKIPESQIIIICSSPDYKEYIINAAKIRKKDLIRAEYVSIFEPQQKQLFLWYMHGANTNHLLDGVLPYKSSLLKETHTKKYLNFNRRWKEHRFAILSLLYSHNLIEDGLISFSKYPVVSDDIYFNNNNSFELMFNDMLNKYPKINEILLAGYNFKNLLPLIIDTHFFQTYFAYDSNHRPLKKYFNNTYFSLVNETFFETGNARFLTEKIYRPIMHKHPFVLVSTPFSLELLREQGYKTFSEFIDESYDCELDDNKRLIKIIKEVEKLCNLNKKELTDFKNYCLPIVEHNYKVFFEKQIQVINLL